MVARADHFRDRDLASANADRLRARTNGLGFAAARRALQEAFGKAPGEAGCGGSIPLVESLKTASPDAEVILWGTSDVAGARIHASDESVDPRRSNG